MSVPVFHDRTCSRGLQPGPLDMNCARCRYLLDLCETVNRRGLRNKTPEVERYRNGKRKRAA